MPKLNLKDDELEGEPDPLDQDRAIAPPPTLREVGGSVHHGSPLLMILVILVVLASGVFALNYFKVIHLWGKRAPKTVEMLPEPSSMPAPAAAEQQPAGSTPVPDASTPVPDASFPASSTTATPAPATKPKVVVPVSGSGLYTVQVSSWTERARADAQAARLTQAGFSAFVEDAAVSGETWYRVRVGRFDTQKEAEQVAAQLQPVVEEVVWVAKVGKR